MLALVARRALVQRRVLAAVVVLVAAAATLLGVCTLLLSATQDRAFHAEVQRSQADDVDVTAYVVGLAGSDLADVRQQARDVVGGVLTPLHPRLTSIATARMRRLEDAHRLAYLASGDGIAPEAELTSGRWPHDAASGRPEAAIPDSTARLLRLHLGERVVLGQEIGLDGADNPVDVVVVGTFRPRDQAGWQGDPLSGQGFDATYSDGSVTAPAYGPFVVGDAAFVATGSSVTGLRVTAHPTLSLATRSSLARAVGKLGHADALLSSRAAGRARITRVASNLPDTLSRIQAQQATTRGTVLVLLVLSLALSLAAALLAGWLLASIRDDERALLVSFGLSRRQQMSAALVEALALAVAATLVAIPVAALVHARLTHLPRLRAAGLTQSPTITWGLVLTVLAGAVALALALVVTVQDSSTASDRSSRRRAAERSGMGALLVGVAAVGWWQLRTQPPTSTVHGDVTLTAAPVLCLAAVTVLAVQVVPLLLAGAARVGDRSRGLVVPLAMQQAARRPHVGTAMVLIAAAAAASVFGLALQTTWGRSQDDQADLRVGTDLSLALLAPAGPQDSIAVAAATGPAATVSPVVDTPLALGSYLGDPGSPPMLVAVDTRHAGELLRGRVDAGTDWSSIGRRLAPHAPAGGIPLPADGTGVELTGRAPAGASITVTPTAVVQDASGFRSSVAATSLPMDGRAHPVDWLGPIVGGARLVAVRLDLDGDPGIDPRGDPGQVQTGEMSVKLRLPGRGGARPSWRLLSARSDSPVRDATASVGADGDGTALTATAGIDLGFFVYTGASLLATALPTPTELPVAVSQDLLDAIGAKVGGRLAASVQEAPVPLRVVAVVPNVPSAPGRVAVLLDADLLSRALVDAGRLDPVVNGWWVSKPSPGVVHALRESSLGQVTTRHEVAAQLRHGPLRATVPTALLTLVVAAAVMLVAGVGLVLSADRQRRSADVARLRALGLTRQDARRVLLVEHGSFVVPLVLVGALVGLVAALALGPHLVRSEVGAAPVPSAVVTVPWAAEALLVGGLLAFSLVLVAVLAAVQIRRSGPADLRAGDL
ncbi:ABC transporter permease [Nocardioides panacihumi]|uniref:ABC transporter permease n=1 Tax=Nocardioides panacihumi TaxID=400774 RepID=A0ABN2RZS3_9ACTN